MVQQNPNGSPHSDAARSGWRVRLPVLSNSRVTLRELKVNDAPALFAHVRKPPVLHYIAPPPSSVSGFQRFIQWSRKERRRGRLACFGIIVAGQTEPAGIIEIWSSNPSFETAEWGFALDDAYWGTGTLQNAARLMLDFAFTRLGVHRLEARAVIANGRGNGVLRKLGATREGVLRSCFPKNGTYMDHVMWSILPKSGSRRARANVE